MKRLMVFGTTASVCLALLLASSNAAEKNPVEPIDKGKFVPDLAIIDFSGGCDDANFNLAGTVKNVGLADYTRTKSVTGQLQGRQIQLNAVNPLKFGTKLKLLRTLSVPSLKINQTWTTGNMKIPSKGVPVTSGSAKFVLMLTKGDVDPANDSKETSVNFPCVR